MEQVASSLSRLRKVIVQQGAQQDEKLSQRSVARRNAETNILAQISALQILENDDLADRQSDKWCNEATLYLLSSAKRAWVSADKKLFSATAVAQSTASESETGDQQRQPPNKLLRSKSEYLDRRENSQFARPVSNVTEVRRQAPAQQQQPRSIVPTQMNPTVTASLQKRDAPRRQSKLMVDVSLIPTENERVFPPERTPSSGSATSPPPAFPPVSSSSATLMSPIQKKSRPTSVCSRQFSVRARAQSLFGDSMTEQEISARLQPQIAPIVVQPQQQQQPQDQPDASPIDVAPQERQIVISHVSTTKSTISLYDTRKPHGDESSRFIRDCEAMNLQHIRLARDLTANRNGCYTRSKALEHLNAMFSNQSMAHKLTDLILSLEDPNQLESVRLVDGEIRTLVGLFAYPRTITRHPDRKVRPSDHSFVCKYGGLMFKEPRLFVRVMCSLNWEDEKQKEDGRTMVRLLLLDQENYQKLTILDALELLCFSKETYRNAGQLAVAILSLYPADEIENFMLQLVQTLRYEPSFGLAEIVQSPVASFLLGASEQNQGIACLLHWYCQVECQSGHKNTPDVAAIFRSVSLALVTRLRASAAGQQTIDVIFRQQYLVDYFTSISKELKESGLGQKEKRSKLLSKLQEPGFESILDPNKHNNLPMYLPLSLRKNIVGINAADAKMFKSAMEPICIPFVEQLVDDSGATSTSMYNVIWKQGDDLRQDQLILQIIRIMDKCLKHHGMDCCLSPYNVIATGPDTGFVELVPKAITLSRVKKIATHLSNLSEKNSVPYETLLNNLTKSMAGYCVITYILGIGDRHLDNLMLQEEDGRLLHIDFGFVLGADPKPWPSPMRITQEMIDVLRPPNDLHFVAFQAYACQAYKILRRYAHLYQLMLYCFCCGSPPLAQVTPDAIRNTVDMRLKLDLTDKEADQHLLNIIQSSYQALMPRIHEQFHVIAQSLR